MFSGHLWQSVRLFTAALLILGNTLQSEAASLPTSYKEVDVVVKTKDVNIGGTLLLPGAPKSELLVILSSGSSWQDRDSTLFDFRMFKVIAEHLASQGIPSFRYDDRGVGTSTGDFVNSTIDDLTADIGRITAHFAHKSAHPFQHFVLLGHSQGGIVAAKAAKQNPGVKGVILAASPGVTIGELILSQTRSEYAKDHFSVVDIENFVSAHNALLYAVPQKKGIEAAMQRFKASYGALLRKRYSGDANAFEKKVIDTAREMKVNYGLPALTSFVHYDPLSDVEALRIPVLSLHGGRDKQVAIEPNKDRLETALLRTDNAYRMVVFDEANHFFQPSKTGTSDEYGSLEKRFVDGFLREISSWIRTL